MAPLQDPLFETWGLAWDYRAITYDKIFEVHDPFTQGWDRYSIENYENYPEKFVTLQTEDWFKIDEFCGGTGFHSSISYMLGKALYEGRKDIWIFGVHALAEEEYAYQRDNLIFLLGFAKARGVNVHIQDGDGIKVRRRFYGLDFPVLLDGLWHYEPLDVQRPANGAHGLVRT